jgi:hypothetical protein
MYCKSDAETCTQRSKSIFGNKVGLSCVEAARKFRRHFHFWTSTRALDLAHGAVSGTLQMASNGEMRVSEGANTTGKTTGKGSGFKRDLLQNMKNINSANASSTLLEQAQKASGVTTTDRVDHENELRH